MIITVAALVAAGIAPTQARLFVDPLAYACSRFEIDTPARIAGFIAQCRVESANFTCLEENLNYTRAERICQVFPGRVRSLDAAGHLVRNPKALANRVYSDRLGNGDEASGDGWLFHGRGLKQLTGRANYADAAAGLGRRYLEFPHMVAEPTDAALTAAWYYATAKCNLLADSAQWDAITRAVNGPAMLQVDLRRQYAQEALLVLA